MHRAPSYAGDLDPATTYERLKGEPEAQLVDVRTEGEWESIGVPDLAEIGKAPIFVEWQQAPAMQVNPGFLDELKAALAARGLGTETPLYFLCRSGARSAAAASLATEAGYEASHNVVDGFEGPPDGTGRRGTVAGWQASRLPWTKR